MALGWQIFIYTILSVAVIYASRKLFPEAFKGNKERAVANADCDDFSHTVAIAEEAIKPGLVGGKVRFEGSYWTARSNEEIAVGEEVRVVARENITLIVEKIKK
jgi:membrane protein implicated in regulation of membrane protease activity